jgi:phospholipid transport system substrate-binding protein
MNPKRLATAARSRAAHPPRPAPARRLSTHAAGIALAMALAAAPRPGLAAPEGGGAIVQTLYRTLLATMKNGGSLGVSGRYAQLAPVIRQIFDLPLMTRLAVGPAWGTLGDAQKQQMIDSFGRYVSATYAERFDSYHGQRLEVTGHEPTPAGVIVRSRIIKANGEPVEVDYLMHGSGGAWQISDIYLDGSISEVATRRSEFTSIIRSQGIGGLIVALNRKADMLTGTAARAY